MDRDSGLIANALGEASQEAENASPKSTSKSCEFCGDEFEPSRFWQKYCSVKCRNDKYWSTHDRKTIPKNVTAGATTSTDTNQPVAKT